ncbi:helix-hairpin-helix domain-containing protein [Enterococcus raffinosus]|uniref:helix-hairpin-helix domain-containing protein n=1 Tax=Enterococcus raffinosus TaxID=71452 RepID=UPI001C0F8655|nr:helix-hairpin-helix domain-containing protein [Enterococcus raffinosus]MBU5361047.1 helix-hairpin-helix domain-containing protein [Enterococcus raffinosus]
MKTKVKKCLLVVVMVFGMAISFGGNRVEASEKVDINSASVEELQRLNGIGTTLAQRIVEARPYKTLDELKSKVTGIGVAKLQAIKDQGLAVAESFPEKVDLNKASLYDLQFLVGVGAPLAQKIIDARPYQSVDELKDKVVGIGEVKLQDIKNQGLAMVTEEKMIKEWFLDENVANMVARNLRKRIEDIVILEDLAEVTKLEYDIGDAFITNFEGIENLVNLTKMDFNLESNISGLSSLKSLTNLSELKLGGWKIDQTTVDAFQNLVNLTKIDLALDSKVYNINSLSKLTNLEDVKIMGGEIDQASVDSLQSLIKLKKLSIKVSDEVSDLSSLGNCINLSELSIAGRNIKPASSLSKLEKLIKLDISGGEMNDVSNLVKLKNLNTLSLYNCGLENIDDRNY